jgi:hypothetical protein
MKLLTKKRNLLLLLLILIGGWLRFFRLKSFTGIDFDQQLAIDLARQILSGKFILIGQEISRGGYFVGPFFNYILAIILFFTHNIYALYIFQASLSLLSGLFIVILLKKNNLKTVVFTLLLYIFSFRFLYFDKNIAPSNWLIPICFFWVYLSQLTSSKIKILLLSFLSGFAASLHPVGIVLVLNSFFLILSAKKTLIIKIKTATVSLVFMSLWFLPPLIFALRHHFINFQLFKPGEADYPLLFRFLTRTHLLVDTLLTSISFHHNYFLLGILTLILILIAIQKFYSKRLLVFIATNLIVFSILPGPVFDYYFIPSLVFFIVWLGTNLSFLTITKLGFLLVTLFLVVFAFDNLTNLIKFHNPYSYEAKVQTVQYLKSHYQNASPLKISFITDPGQNFGWDPLFNQYNLPVDTNMNTSGVIICIPATLCNPDKIFDGIGIVNGN